MPRYTRKRRIDTTPVQYKGYEIGFEVTPYSIYARAMRHGRLEFHTLKVHKSEALRVLKGEIDQSKRMENLFEGSTSTGAACEKLKRDFIDFKIPNGRR